MAKKVRIELISKGWREIVNCPGTQKVCDEVGQRIADEAGDGFEWKSQKINWGGGRAGGLVVANTYDAKLSEARFKSLSKAVHS